MERQMKHPSFNEVQQYVSDCQYPCSKQELISCARQHQAPYEVIQTLESVNQPTEFGDVNDVKESIEQNL